jgi:hypothetical protein
MYGGVEQSCTARTRVFEREKGDVFDEEVEEVRAVS